MATLSDVYLSLRRKGWYLTSYGISSSMNEQNLSTEDDIISAALNFDLRSVGEKCLPDSLSKSGLKEVSGPIVLQIQKIRNVAAPNLKQHVESTKNRLLRLQLTDGHVHCSAIEFKGIIPGLNSSTPPGTKLILRSKVNVAGGFLLLTPSTVTVLGGQVEHMIKKWNLEKGISSHFQRLVPTGAGPPPFQPFSLSGQKQKDYTNPSKKKSHDDSLTTSRQTVKNTGSDKRQPAKLEDQKVMRCDLAHTLTGKTSQFSSSSKRYAKVGGRESQHKERVYESVLEKSKETSTNSTDLKSRKMSPKVTTPSHWDTTGQGRGQHLERHSDSCSPHLDESQVVTPKYTSKRANKHSSQQYSTFKEQSDVQGMSDSICKLSLQQKEPRNPCSSVHPSHSVKFDWESALLPTMQSSIPFSAKPQEPK